MPNFKSDGGLLAAALLTLITTLGTAQASTFAIDAFKISENGNTYFLDTFSDGSAPDDSANANPAPVDVNPYNRAYLTNTGGPLPGPESGGKLYLDTADGELGIGTVYPVPTRTLRARVNSSTNSANASALTATDVIDVRAIFDLTRPDVANDKYSIRLTDWANDAQNEALELAVSLDDSNHWTVALRQAEIGVQWHDLELWYLDGIANILDYEQIRLNLYTDTAVANGTEFTGAFTLIDNDAVHADQVFTSSINGLMFQSSDFLRAGFTARERAEVPVPPVFALGLATLIGAQVRRRLRR